MTEKCAVTSKTESLADRFKAKFSQAHSQSRPLIISWELAVEIRDALSGSSSAPETGLAGQIEAARARIASWPADVRAAMGLPVETTEQPWVAAADKLLEKIAHLPGIEAERRALIAAMPSPEEPTPVPASTADQASTQRVGSAVAGGGSEKATTEDPEKDRLRAELSVSRHRVQTLERRLDAEKATTCEHGHNPNVCRDCHGAEEPSAFRWICPKCTTVVAIGNAACNVCQSPRPAEKVTEPLYRLRPLCICDNALTNQNPVCPIHGSFENGDG